MTGDSDFQLDQLEAVLLDKMTKRKVEITYFDRSSKIEKLGGDKVRRVYKIRNGIDAELAKKIVAAIKNAKLKTQGSIQGDTVRVTGKNRDDLQVAIALIKKEFADMPLNCGNFRD